MEKLVRYSLFELPLLIILLVSKTIFGIWKATDAPKIKFLISIYLFDCVKAIVSLTVMAFISRTVYIFLDLSRDMRFPTMWFMCDQQRLIPACAYAHTDQSLCRTIEYSMTALKLLTEQNLKFLSLTRGCTGSSESTLVKMSHCWKSHVVAWQFF